ncbi:MAG: hypothetical protein IPL35_05750 [Sphingobacteriales bacterium]|nr:hypothetical protein [Sphingobacteriales bacterium]
MQRVEQGAEAEITLARPQPRWSWQWKIAADGGKSTQFTSYFGKCCRVGENNFPIHRSGN